MSLTRISFALALALGSSVTLAADPDQAIRQSLKSLDANLPIEAIAESPLAGIYQVQLEGGRQLYTCLLYTSAAHRSRCHSRSPGLAPRARLSGALHGALSFRPAGLLPFPAA